MLYVGLMHRYKMLCVLRTVVHTCNLSGAYLLGEAGRQTNCRDIFFAFFQNRTTHSKELITPEKDKHKLMTG